MSNPLWFELRQVKAHVVRHLNIVDSKLVDYQTVNENASTNRLSKITVKPLFAGIQ